MDGRNPFASPLAMLLLPLRYTFFSTALLVPTHLQQGDESWVDLTKTFNKQDVPRKEEGQIELLFRIRFYPVDVTQVLQYVTLYQTFLAARQVRTLSQENKKRGELISIQLLYSFAKTYPYLSFAERRVVTSFRMSGRSISEGAA